MRNLLIYPTGTTEACSYAVQRLQMLQIPLTDHPEPDITHLLLDVPMHTDNLDYILSTLPPQVVLIGGNIPEGCRERYNCMDLLQDETYLCENAAITAECTILLAAQKLDYVFKGLNAVVIGAGRIGIQLAALLKKIGTDVTLCSGSVGKAALLHSLGFQTSALRDMPQLLRSCQLLINTAPALTLTGSVLDSLPNCLQLDLASSPGLQGENVISARGLPNRLRPKSAGHLIANTVFRLLQEDKT